MLYVGVGGIGDVGVGDVGGVDVFGGLVEDGGEVEIPRLSLCRKKGERGGEELEGGEEGEEEEEEEGEEGEEEEGRDAFN